MKKIFISAFVIAIFLAFALLFLDQKYFDKNNIEITKDLQELQCDMNEKPSCEVKFNGGIIQFSLSPKPIYTMQPINLKINGLQKLNLKNPNLRVYGVNMDMGIIKAQIDLKEGVYQSDLVLSSCLMSIMRYRFKIYDGSKDTGLFIDFDLRQ